MSPAYIDPSHAPRLLPSPMIGNRRLPCSSVLRSLANPQNCAMTMTLKMPTHRKNGTAITTPRRPST